MDRLEWILRLIVSGGHRGGLGLVWAWALVWLPSLEGVGQPAYACIDKGVHAQQLRIAEGEGVVHRNVALDASRRVGEHADPAIIDPNTIQHNPTRYI